MDIITRW